MDQPQISEFLEKSCSINLVNIRGISWQDMWFAKVRKEYNEDISFDC